jgi:glycosyltransferase involved in cell wall biosynthesis
MKILNSMFAMGLGGIEQAFIDYTNALLNQNHQAVCVIRRNAEIKKVLQRQNLYNNENVTIYEVANCLGKFDFLARSKLAETIKKEKPDATICHGNRAISICLAPSNSQNIPFIGVAHNYSMKRIVKADYIFSITNDLKNKISETGFAKDKIFLTPNMIEINAPEPEFRPYQNPPVIGVMARFVKKKGVDIFLKALSALKADNIPFKAIIAGDGEERDNLQKLRDDLKLNNEVQFIGWAKDKEKFYDSIDIFCLPSTHEPFGIVILEAMLHKKPIVSSETEGPLEIIENKQDGILFENGHSGKLAMALKEMITNEKQGKSLAENAYPKVIAKYSMENVSKIISKNLEEIIAKTS